MKKRILSMLLCLVMVFGLLPGQAIAVGNLPFNDVKVTSWFYDEVKYVYENGLMTGTSDTTFSPNGTTTRGMVVTILWRLDGEPDSTEMRFADVAAGRYYTDAVMWASSNNIAGGHGDGNFGPNDPITREQLAVILYRYAHHKGYDVSGEADLSAFTDRDTTSDYAVNAMAWANDTGLITGVTDTTLAPLGNATRAQVAAILMRFCEGVVKAIDGVDDEINEEPDIADEEDDSKGPDKPLSRPPHRPDDSDTYYTITFDANGSDVENLPEVQRVKAGECAVEPVSPIRDGYVHLGWMLEHDGIEKFDFNTQIDSNITLYALWAKKSGTSDSIYITDREHIKYDTNEQIYYIDNILLVFTRDNLTNTEKERIARSIDGIIVGSLESVSNILQIRVKSSTVSELSSLADQLMASNNVYFAMYDMPQYDMLIDGIYSYDNSDRWNGDKWNEDFPNGSNWAWESMYVYSAWNNYSDYFSDINVGVIDSGFDTNHTELFGKIEFPSSQYASENIADSHGTAVAGIISASNNNTGLCGVAYNSKLYCIDSDSLDNISGDYDSFMNLTVALDDFLAKDIKIVNMSIGHKLFDSELYDDYTNLYHTGMSYTNYVGTAYRMAYSEGKYYAAYIADKIVQGYDPLYIKSAGNGLNNSYATPVDAFLSGTFAACDADICEFIENQFNISPGDIKSHILIVSSIKNAKTTSTIYKRPGSNTGNTVDICAPGEDIYTTDINGGYCYDNVNGKGTFGGTSAATPFVTGVAALVWSVNPALTATEVKNILTTETSYKAEGFGHNITRGLGVSGTSLNLPTSYFVYPVVNANLAVKKALLTAITTVDFDFVENPFISGISDKKISSTSIKVKSLAYDGYYGNLDETVINAEWLFNILSNKTSVSVTLPVGKYRLEFNATGYSTVTQTFEISANTGTVTVYMTPEGMVIPPVEPGFNITGTFVYWNDANKEIPVSFAKCMLTDVTNSNIIYFAEVADGKLSNESFSTKPPAGTYLFELEGGDKDANGFYSYKLIDTVAVTSDLDMGKVYCDRVADVNCWVTDEDGNALNRVSMTITQNGCEIVRIASFYGGFTIPLQKGTYMLTLTCDGYLPVEKEFTVNGTTDLGVIKMSTATVMTKTMHIRFVDSKSGAALKISDIFEDTSYIGIGHSGLSEGEEFIAGDFIDGGRGTNAFTVNDDKELVFGDVPVIEEMGNYYLIFDSVEKGYLFPNTYTIPSLDLVENAAGEWTAEIELEKVALIVGDVAVTSENALDILGDGTARYDAGSGVLTLTNANIIADYVVSTNMDQLTVEIPSGTTTTLTIAPVDYRGYTAAIEASRDLSILGGGTLIINGDKEVNAICGGYQYSNDEEYELSISDVTVQMPSNNTTGITANRGNLILRNATVLKTGEEDYGHLITGKSIDIIESKIEVISAGTKLIWSAGGDITIVDSVIKLDVDSTRNVYYSIFAEMGAISISGTSAIEIISEETDTSTDYEFLTATNGIQVEDGLLITGSDNVLCEIYQNSSLDSYSVRYKEEEERYPTMISVAGSSW